MRHLTRGTVYAMGVLVLIASWTPRAHAQGCVLCYTSIAAAGSAAMHNFEIAMLVLLVPALVLFASILLLIWRRASQAEGEAVLPPLKPNRFRRFALRFARPAEGRL